MACRLPITMVLIDCCSFASSLSTISWSCGTVYCSVAFALPRTLLAAWAVRPLLPYGMALVARSVARSAASATVPLHSASVPAALPRMIPCHLSGILMGPSTRRSCVRVSPRSFFFLARREGESAKRAGNNFFFFFRK